MGRRKESAHGSFIFVRPWEQMFPWPFFIHSGTALPKIADHGAGFKGSVFGQSNALKKKTSRVGRWQ